jgi:hypothetical protein
MGMNVQGGPTGAMDAVMKHAAQFKEQLSGITKAFTDEENLEIASKETLQTELADASPPQYVKKPKEDMPAPQVRKVKKTDQPEEKKTLEDDVGQKAKEFIQGHKEFDREDLEKLHESIDQNDDVDTILAKVKARFPKASKADDAFEFLLLTTKGDLRTKIQDAKNLHYEANTREINGGRQLTKIARESADQAFGLGKTQKLDSIFTDMVAEGADSNTLHKQLTAQYEYKDMKKLLEYVYKTAGHELNFQVKTTKNGLELETKSIEKEYLLALCKEIRNIQGIMNTYRAAEKGMPSMEAKATRDDEQWKLWMANR